MTFGTASGDNGSWNTNPGSKSVNNSATSAGNGYCAPATGATKDSAHMSSFIKTDAVMTLDASARSLKGTATWDSTFYVLPQKLNTWRSSTRNKADSTSGTYIGILCKVSVCPKGDGSSYTQVYPVQNNTYGWAITGVGEGKSWEPGKHYIYTLTFMATDNNGCGYVGPHGVVAGEGYDAGVTVSKYPKNNSTLGPGTPVLGGPIQFSTEITDWDTANETISM